MRVTMFAAAAIAVTAALPVAPTAVLFVGNSFTFGEGSPVKTWRPESVTDLNHERIGGVPALFKAFTKEAGLEYDVSLETHPGVGLDYHLQSRHDLLASRPWDIVVMHGYSTLDSAKPGDPAKLIETTRQMAELLTGRNPKVEIHLTATWSRADQTYPATGHWYGRPIAAMAADVQDGYEKAAKTSPAIKSVIPVGHAWIRAIETGVADPNPYDGVTPGQLDLWARDHYHASTDGYYLEALMVFGDLTGRDPRSLGDTECAAFELGMSIVEVKALQQVAFDELASTRKVRAAPRRSSSGTPQRCDASDRVQDDPVAQLRAVDDSRETALRRADVVALSRIYADEFVMITSTGQIRTKQDQLRDIGSGADQHRGPAERVLDTHVYGNVAVVHAESAAGSLVVNGVPDPNVRRYTRVYVHRDGRWQLADTHMSIVTPVR